jgi:cell division protease FtsH
MIDVEVRNLIDRAYQRTKQLLTEKRDGLEKLAEKLLEKEILFQSDLEEILGKRPFDNRTTYDEFVNGIEPKEEIEEIKQEETVDQSIDLPKKSSKKD